MIRCLFVAPMHMYVLGSQVSRRTCSSTDASLKNSALRFEAVENSTFRMQPTNPVDFSSVCGIERLARRAKVWRERRYEMREWFKCYLPMGGIPPTTIGEPVSTFVFRFRVVWNVTVTLLIPSTWRKPLLLTFCPLMECHSPLHSWRFSGL